VPYVSVGNDEDGAGIGSMPPSTPEGRTTLDAAAHGASGAGRSRIGVSAGSNRQHKGAAGRNARAASTTMATTAPATTIWPKRPSKFHRKPSVYVGFELGGDGDV
jgi:hypothetical protein